MELELADEQCAVCHPQYSVYRNSWGHRMLRKAILRKSGEEVWLCPKHANLITNATEALDKISLRAAAEPAAETAAAPAAEERK